MFLIISIITGFLVALMIQVNGVLQDSIGGVNSLLSIHLAGIAGALLMFMVLRKKMKGSSDAGTPIYYLCAGMVGILIVYFSSVLFSEGRDPRCTERLARGADADGGSNGEFLSAGAKAVFDCSANTFSCTAFAGVSHNRNKGGYRSRMAPFFMASGNPSDDPAVDECRKHRKVGHA